MKILKTLIITAMLASPFTAFAIGGDDPINGIDIIIKKNPGSARPIAPIRITGGTLKKYNSLKASGRAVYLSKIVSQKVMRITTGNAPKGGWQKTIQRSLAKHWCGPCKMATFTLNAKTEKASYKLTFRPKASQTKPSIVKMKAKTAIKSQIKKK